MSDTRGLLLENDNFKLIKARFANAVKNLAGNFEQFNYPRNSFDSADLEDLFVIETHATVFKLLCLRSLQQFPDYLTPAQASKILSIPVPRLAYERREEMGLAFTKVGSRVFYKTEDVIALLLQNTAVSPWVINALDRDRIFSQSAASSPYLGSNVIPFQKGLGPSE